MLASKFDTPQTGLHLFDTPTSADGGLTRAAAEARFAAQCTELAELQELLFAAGTHGLLIVLQGRDAAGKDGTVRYVGGAMNPAGTRVMAFKVPTPHERAHDFLWRIHHEVPAKGEVVFFNRSHYEDILVPRVHKLTPESVWKARYAQINAFETLLAESGILVVKFFLHISKDEQERRLLERENDPVKAWKLNASDWQERPYWDDFTAAYEDIIERCSTPDAPWYIVPSDKKWFRNVAIAEVLIETLRPHKEAWKRTLTDLATTQKEMLTNVRAAQVK